MFIFHIFSERQGRRSRSLIGDWTTETIAVDGLTGTEFQLRVTMGNNADDEMLRFDDVLPTGVAEPYSAIAIMR